MALYRFSAQILGRSNGRSAVAAAAYRAAESLRQVVSVVASAAYRSGSEVSGDDGQAFDYSRKRGVAHAEIVLPTGTPLWMNDRERLWNAVESSERRKDSQLAREVQLGLPRELDREAQIGLVRGFVTEQFVALGMVADFAIHDVKARDGGRQPHAHVMLTMRRIDTESPTGFGLKEKSWNSKELLCEWRAAWADHVNAALEQAAIAERVDHRTLEAQRQDAVAVGDFDKAAELDREPEPKVGPTAWKLERDGIRTDRGDLLREVQERNAAVREVYEEVATHGPEEQARFLAVREQAGDALDAFVAWGEEVIEHARAWTRGAMVAAGIGAAALGLLPERDSFQEAPVAVTAPASPREDHAARGGDADIMALLDQMAHEDRLAAVEAMAAVERERAEAAGMEFAYPPYVLAIEDVEDRLAAVEAEEAAIAREPQDRAAELAALESDALARDQADQERAEIEWEGDQENGGAAKDKLGAIEREDAELEAEVEDAERGEVDRDMEALFAQMDREARIEREEQGLEIGG